MTMIDPFSGWSRWLDAGLAMTRTSLATAEMLGAAGEVIAARGAMMGGTTPGHRAELGLMVPEKIEAFSHSGSAAFAVIQGAQAAWLEQWQQVGAQCNASAAQGRPLTLGELAAISQHAAGLALETVEVSARVSAAALAPVHRRATANARRLKRRTPRR